MCMMLFNSCLQETYSCPSLKICNYCRKLYLAMCITLVGCDGISVIHKTVLSWLEARGHISFNQIRLTFLGSHFCIFLVASDRNCLFKLTFMIICCVSIILLKFLLNCILRERKNNVILTQNMFGKGSLRSPFLLKSYQKFLRNCQRSPFELGDLGLWF